MLKKLLSLFLVVTTSFAISACTSGGSSTQSKEIKNVILLIGDGMGPNQIKAGELYKQEKLFMQTIEQVVKVNTCSYYDDVTDSAAAATALATGIRTSNGKVGKDIAGNDLTTLMDIASSQGKRTGVITTEELYGATPMGFSAHSLARGNSEELMQSAAISSNVNLFASYSLPSSKSYMTQFFVESGYELINSPEDFSTATQEKVIGHFKILAAVESMLISDLAVSFDGLVSKALDYLSQDEDGFFLMAEGAHIDHGGHNNDIQYMLEELVSFDDMVKYVVKWAKNRGDTLVLVTADHETGGLYIDENTKYGDLFEYDFAGDFKNFRWTTTGHTATPVNLYAYGAEIDFEEYTTLTSTMLKNVDVFNIIYKYLTGEDYSVNER